MKKIAFVLFVGIIVNSVIALPINVKNAVSYFGSDKQNIILVPDKGKIKSSDNTWEEQVVNSLADKAYIDNQLFYNLYQWEQSQEYPWAFIGYKMYLADTQGDAGPYLGYFSFIVHANPNDDAGIISSVSFSDDGRDPNYHFQSKPGMNYTSQANFEIYGTLAEGDYTIPIITNLGWYSGMGNSYSIFTPDASFWVQDYGMDEVGRWTVSDSEQAIQQSTQPISGTNVGSRAYPVVKDSQGNYQLGVGDAFEGVWQIDIKIGSNGGGDLCETFYLAERENLEPGPQNYMDGSSAGGDGGIGREIDIMETKWHPDGPQVNLASGGGTSWNSSKYQSVQMGKWSDVGGAPTSQFITFGAYINGTNLWLYSYKSDGALWYSTESIPLSSSYVQKSSFVPYIGTWGSRAGNFYTKYKNFIYLPSSAIPGSINPKDNPTEFYNTVHGM